jgi:tetratricopeptide (TPR) repeat protein
MMIAARLSRVLVSLRFLALAFVSGTLLFLVACQPAAGNSTANGSNSASNEAGAGNSPVTDGAKPEAPKEAKYPHQVIAALAKVYLQYGIIDEALRLYDLAIVQQLRQTNTEDAENWIGLADALVKANEKAKAEQAYKRALAIYDKLLQEKMVGGTASDPKLANFYISRIAVLYQVLGDNANRLKYLGMLIADEKSAAEQLELAKIHAGLKNFEKAEAAFKKALELTKDNLKENATVKVEYARSLRDAKREDDALAQIKDLVNNKEITEEARKAARRLMFEIYEARGTLDKIDFK